MKKYIIIGIVLTILAALGYWYFFIRMTKEKAIYTLVEGGMHSNAESLQSLEESYLIAWAKAFKKGQETFQDKGKTYNTKGGRAKA